jgi:hypothetical protein
MADAGAVLYYILNSVVVFDRRKKPPLGRLFLFQASVHFALPV